MLSAAYFCQHYLTNLSIGANNVDQGLHCQKGFQNISAEDKADNFFVIGALLKG